jgi:hypothetical protein
MPWSGPAVKRSKRTPSSAPRRSPTTASNSGNDTLSQLRITRDGNDGPGGSLGHDKVQQPTAGHHSLNAPGSAAHGTEAGAALGGPHKVPGMRTYCARVRFRLGARVRIASEEAELAVETEAERDVVLRSSPDSLPLSQAEHIVLLARPYRSEAEADEAAVRWLAVLARAFARLNIGADFGARAATGTATASGLAWLEAQHGGRVVDDVHGAMVFECEPWPKFVRSEASGTVGKPAERVQAVVRAAARRTLVMSAPELLAFDLFSASFSAESADARFVLLMMAVETLIEPQPRAGPVVAHVDALITATQQSGLPKNEIESLSGSLQWLRSESIGQAGRKLAARLGDRLYADQSPPAFFSKCYELRSSLVHGAYPRPSWSEVGQRAAALELFVRDLLSIDLIEEFPEA